MTDRRALLEKARAVRAQEEAGPGVPSPCVSVCRMDAASGLCEGCLRSLDEIAAWGTLDDDGRRAVWRLVEQRVGASA